MARDKPCQECIEEEPLSPKCLGDATKHEEAPEQTTTGCTPEFGHVPKRACGRYTVVSCEWLLLVYSLTIACLVLVSFGTRKHESPTPPAPCAYLQKPPPATSDFYWC